MAGAGTAASVDGEYQKTTGGKAVCKGDRREHLPSEAPGQAGVSEDVPLLQESRQPPESV
jgi:hypothetical protein